MTKFLLINLIYIIGFSLVFILQGNYEFLFYIAVMLSLLFLIFISDKKVHYPKIIFVGFTVWGIIHMMGGGLFFKGTRFYDLMLFTVSQEYSILKYDQLAHLVANYVATILLFVIIKPHLKEPIKHWFALSVIIIMAGSGIGAMNEIIEFIAFVFTKSDGVGGYINTALDLVFNLFGGILAMIYVFRKKGNL